MPYRPSPLCLKPHDASEFFLFHLYTRCLRRKSVKARIFQHFDSTQRLHEEQSLYICTHTNRHSRYNSKEDSRIAHFLPRLREIVVCGLDNPTHQHRLLLQDRLGTAQHLLLLPLRAKVSHPSYFEYACLRF